MTEQDLPSFVQSLYKLWEDTDVAHRERRQMIGSLLTGSFETPFMQEYLQAVVTLFRARIDVPSPSVAASEQLGRILGLAEGIQRAQFDARATAIVKDLMSRRNAQTIYALLNWFYGYYGQRIPRSTIVKHFIGSTPTINRRQVQKPLALLDKYLIIAASNEVLDKDEDPVETLQLSLLGMAVHRKMQDLQTK